MKGNLEVKSDTKYAERLGISKKKYERKANKQTTQTNHHVKKVHPQILTSRVHQPAVGHEVH